MRKFAGICVLILFLAACTTTRAPTDAKRAAELNAELGLGYLKQGQYKRALHKLDKALKFDSDNANAHHYKAELYRRLNDPAKAEAEYKIAIDLASDNLTIKNNYGVFLCDTGRYDEAIALFKKPLTDPIYANKASSYENIGLCELRQGKVAKAEKAFTQALKYNPKMAKSLLKLAQIRFDGGNSVAAYSLYTRYLTVAQQTPESLWLGILLESARGSKNTVASYKVKLKGKYPDSEETKLLLKLEKQGKL
ncbi:MAG: type IV pilus biogenesis/stability protein PilW [Thioalkalispiraceae bacterium]|jgi:type IV pilus assembly protein PilF